MADAPRTIDRWTIFLRSGGVTILFVLLTVIMTWPQALVLKTHAYDHQDVFFNLWRLRWIAHALSTAPAELFNGNIFEPDRGVLAYSDAMLVEGILAAPLLWAGVPPVLVHNLMMLGPIVASGVGAFVLARHLTGSAGGALAAGVIFAFAPYRFEHYMHMELQWTVWSPWAFWALQRTLETASIGFGLLTGLFLALQMTSSVYLRDIHLRPARSRRTAPVAAPARSSAGANRARTRAGGSARGVGVRGVFDSLHGGGGKSRHAPGGSGQRKQCGARRLSRRNTHECAVQLV